MKNIKSLKIFKFKNKFSINTLRKFINLIGVWLFIILFFNSCGCDDDEYFKIEGIKVNHIQSMGRAVGVKINDTLDELTANKYECLNEDCSKKIAIPDYYINVAFKNDYYTQNNCFNIIPKAYAFRKCPGNGYKGSKEYISKIDIIAHSKFDSTHKVGDTINDLFTIDLFSPSYNYKTFKINYVKNYQFKGDVNGFILYIRKKPTIDTIHQFTVKLYLSDGKIFSGKTKYIIIK